MCQFNEQLFEKQSQTRAEPVKPIIEGLIGRQIWEPGKPVSSDIIVDAALPEMPAKMTEEIDGDEFLIGESRLVIIAHALNFQERMFIVNSTDPDIELDELMFHNPILQLFVGLLFYS